MSSETEIFCHSGPMHQTTVDWNNIHHRRIVAASLVQGVYVLERDRQQNRRGPHALAPPWWQFFHFQLLYLLVDDVDNSIFGALYQYKIPVLTQCAPRYVIAFRGTDKGEACLQDLHLDVQIIKNRLHKTPRFKTAMQVVQEWVDAVGGSNIWLAGHSLGSAIAMLAGKNMAKMGTCIEVFLFNSPFISVPIDKFLCKKLKHGIHFAKSVITAGLTVAMMGRHGQTSAGSEQAGSFEALSAWVPYLFLNPSDSISSGYIEHFKHSKRMEQIGAGRLNKLAIQNSIRGLLWKLFGRESSEEDYEPLHFLPSVKLIINRSPSQTFKQSHGISQWWRPDLHLEYSEVANRYS